VGNLTPNARTGSLLSQFDLKRNTAVNFYLDQPFALPFQLSNLSAILYVDSIKGDAIGLDLNLTLYDWNGVSLVQVATQQWHVTTNNVVDYQSMTFVFAPVNYTFPNAHQVRLQVLNRDSSGDDALLATNATNTDSQLDVLTTTYTHVDQLLLRDGKGPATVWSPKDRLVVWANVSDPFGSRDVAGARINVTDPLGNAVLTWSSMVPILNGTAWRRFQSSVLPLLANGTYRVGVVAIETNGDTNAASATALVRAPRFTLEKVANVRQAKAGALYTYTIWFNDTGTGPAGRVWINDTMPSQLTFVSSPNATAVPSTPIWSVVNVGVGAHWVSFDVRVQGSTTAAFLRNWVSVNVSDEKGYRWPMLVAQSDVVVNGPVMALALASAPTTWVHSNQTAVYTISLSNSGDPAQSIWLNDTLSARLTYVSDTHNPAWGTATVVGNAIDFVFANMASGATWTFTITARAGPSLVRGAVLSNVVSLNDTSVNGILMPSQTKALPLTVAAPWIPSASLAFPRPTATPGDVLLVALNVTNAGNEPAATAWINLTLDPYLSFVDASVAHSVSGATVLLTASAVRVGVSTVFLNLSVNLAAADRQTLSINGTLDYVDGVSNPVPRVVVPATTTRVAQPRLSVAASPVSITLEAGTLAAVRVTLTNTGTGSAADAWVNLSLPGGFAYVSDNSDGTRTVVGSTYSWHWQALPPGTKTFTLSLQATPGVADKSSANLVFRTNATDANGNLQPGATFSVHGSFVAPSVALALTQDADTSLPGGSFSYVVTVRNDGSTTAHYVNVSDPLDGRLELVSYRSSVPATGSQRLSWNFTDLQPGASEPITLVVRVADSVAADSRLPNTVETRYSNSVGTPIGYTRSLPVILTVVAGFIPIAYILIGGAALGCVVVYLMYRRNRVQIEEVFLVYRDGLLISHLSRTMVQDKDRDQLSGMLTVVQDFVKDAFTYGEHRELHQMEFGDYHILIEQGKHVYLAVVYLGRDSNTIRRKVRHALDLVEEAYGRVLEKWEGSMDEVIGTRDVLRDQLLGGRRLLVRPG